MKKLNLLLITSFIFLIDCHCQIKKCTISGKVVGRPSSSIVLIDALDRPDRPIVEIPVRDSTFTFELDANPVKAYWLIFEDQYRSSDGLRPIIIFPDQEKIRLILFDSKRIVQNKIYGGKLNNQFAEFISELNSKYNSLIKPYYDSLEVLRHSDNYYKKVNQKIDSLEKERHSWCYKYYDQNQTIVSYYLLLDELSIGFNIGRFNEKYSDLGKIKNLVLNLSAKYPDHPYNKRASDLIAAYDKIKVGGDFIDFTLPDIDGNKITLSQVIKGKISLIDLWASWCGSCIIISRSMIPVYNEFKNSGFTIIGVANEIDNTDKLRMALEREKFPWLNLVEINNQNAIWSKYRIPNAAGGTFLVDKDGKILAISPSAEEVRTILTKKLK